MQGTNRSTSELVLMMNFYTGLVKFGVRFFRARPYSLAFVLVGFLSLWLDDMMILAGELVYLGEVYAWLSWLGLLTALLILSEVKSEVKKEPSNL